MNVPASGQSLMSRAPAQGKKRKKKKPQTVYSSSYSGDVGSPRKGRELHTRDGSMVTGRGERKKGGTPALFPKERQRKTKKRQGDGGLVSGKKSKWFNHEPKRRIFTQGSAKNKKGGNERRQTRRAKPNLHQSSSRAAWAMRGKKTLSARVKNSEDERRETNQRRKKSTNSG